MEIQNWRDGTYTSNVIGIFDIYLGSKWGITYKNFRLTLTKKGYPLLAFPSFCVDCEDGKKVWIPYIEMNLEKKEAFTKEVMDLVKPFAQKRMDIHRGASL